jgi:hypothetical protein
MQGMERVKDYFTQDYIISLVENELYSAAGVSEVESVATPAVKLR